MTPFPKLEDYLAPPPLPAIIAVLMTLGFLYLGRRLAAALYPESPDPLPKAAGFIIVAALIAAAAHLLAFLKLAYLWPLRIMAGSLMVLGVLELLRLINREKLSHFRGQIILAFAEQGFWGRAALTLLGLSLLGLGLAVLGPPSDSDSLNYHLGVPLEVLRQHGAFPRADWLYPRLTGLGESLNMLGLAGGTDIWGACLQLAGLLAVLLSLAAMAQDNFQRLWLAMFVLGCPVMAFLVLSQKPQMLPMAASTVALVMIVRRGQIIDLPTLALAFGCLFFAMACKYTFLLSGFIVVGAGLVAAHRAGRLGAALGLALAAYLLLVFPVHLQNYLFYGDPLSPFLERFRPQGDPELIQFAAFHREYADFPGSWLFLPVRLVIPGSLETLTDTLGVGAWLILGVVGKIKEPGPPRVLIGCAFLAVVATLVLGQIGGRFFLEPYLWLVAAAALAAWAPGKKWLFRLMVGQMLLMTLISWFCAATLFPGALTGSWRHKVMARSVFGYAETRWLDKVLPPESVILTDLPYTALLPRPFWVMYPVSLQRLAKELAQPKDHVTRPGGRPKPDTLVTYYPLHEEFRQILDRRLAGLLAGPQTFPTATRNPGRQVQMNQIIIYRLRPH